MTPATICCAFIGCKVFALDAAMPFDFETKASARLRAQTSLRIGIVGFGTFGQFLAKRLVQQGHKVSLCLCSHHTHNTLMHIATHFWAIHVYVHASKQCPWLHSITADLLTKKVQQSLCHLPLYHSSNHKSGSFASVLPSQHFSLSAVQCQS